MISLELLKSHAERLRSARLPDMAAGSDATLSSAGWQVDMTRQRLDTEATATLLGAGVAAGMEADITALFSGAIVNPSENRPALHWALRAPATLTEMQAESVRRSLEAADLFAGRVHAGDARGCTGLPFSAIIHIGIGGSDFGPRLLAEALTPVAAPAIELRFCANLDPVDLDLAMSGLDPARTLVVGVSKSFGTEETLYNLSRARDWLSAHLGDGWPAHMALVTANPARANAWLGAEAPRATLLDMPESVGGRFSIWSAASVAIAATFGTAAFRAFRAGASDMDAHVLTAPLADNVPARLALLDVWNRNLMGHDQRVMLAYARRLRLLPAYLQQLEMESNGKSVTPAGKALPHDTAPTLWGGEGSIGQHSYHQFLHQGTSVIPAEFILAPDHSGDTEGRRALAAHALAQAEVFANGRSLAEVMAEEPGIAEAVARQKVHPGGRPSTFLIHKAFDAHALGALIALYEHRTYLAGRLWGVNSFDQWGVERGKTMAGRIKAALMPGAEAPDDVATARLAASMDGMFD